MNNLLCLYFQFTFQLGILYSRIKNLAAEFLAQCIIFFRLQNYKEKQYCRLWQEVKKDEDWSRTKKSLPLSELGKYSKNPLRQSFSELGAKLGTLEELVSETNQNRKQYALLFPAQEVRIPLCAYLLTRISPLI